MILDSNWFIRGKRNGKWRYFCCPLTLNFICIAVHIICLRGFSQAIWSDTRFPRQVPRAARPWVSDRVSTFPKTENLWMAQASDINLLNKTLDPDFCKAVYYIKHYKIKRNVCNHNMAFGCFSLLRLAQHISCILSHIAVSKKQYE